MIFSRIFSGMPVPLSFTDDQDRAVLRCSAYLNRWFIIRPRSFCFLVHRIKGIAEQVDEHPADVLLHDVYFGQIVIKMRYQFSIKVFILCPQAMVGEF